MGWAVTQIYLQARLCLRYAAPKSPVRFGVKSYEWILLCVPQVRVDNAFSHE